MSRLREISLFECDVRVLRNGFCKLTQINGFLGLDWRAADHELQGDRFLHKIWYLGMCSSSLIRH